ncbi:MAG: TauD/TfdA family dioxygenase [Pseudomonadales bacterium]
MLDVTPITTNIGADIAGVDLTDLSDQVFAAIYGCWLDHQVIRFRDQRLDDDQLQAFSRRFGPLERAPLGFLSEAERERVDNPYVTVISNIRQDGKPIGGLGNAEAIWHSDMTYLETPPPASVLLAIEVPSRGGDTYFASQYGAYESLPAPLRERVAGLSIKHDAAHTSIGRLRPGYAAFDDPREAPGAVHPMVQRHAETGRTCLYLGRRDYAYVPGLELADSEALLDELWRYAALPEYVMVQSWRPGDLVVWDNRCVLHRRDGFDDAERRLMKRCQVLAA